MLLRILAIGFIWFSCSAAWLILGGTVTSRTDDQQRELHGGVGALFGGAVVQAEPSVTYLVPVEREERVQLPDGKSELRRTTVLETRRVELAATDLDVKLALDQRRKGLLWFSTFRADFTGRFRVAGPEAEGKELTFALALPPAAAAYDDLRVEVNGVPVAAPFRGGGVVAPVRLAAGEAAVVTVHYLTGGLDAFRYSLDGSISRVTAFNLAITTDFEGHDFPAGTLSPTAVTPDGTGSRLSWSFRDLVTRLDLGVATPHRMNPGPFVARLSFFAPVALLFLFFALFVLVEVRGFSLHPMHYAFVGAGTFAFHLLLAYLGDLVPLELAFGAAAATSTGLVVSYLARAISTRFALRYAGPAHLLYLVLFSAAFFAEGFTGLTIAVGAIASLFLAMQLTARIRWSERFGGGAAAVTPGARPGA